MPQCQFLVFCCFCVSEMLHRKYSQNWTKQVPELLFSRMKDEDRKRAGGGPGASLTPGWRGPAPGRAPYVGGVPGSPLTTPLRLYKASGWKTLGESAIFQKEFRSSAATVNKFRGTEVCSGTLPGRGSAPGAISIGLHRRLRHLHRPHRHLHQPCCLL
jgi:hypothetical protein